MKNILVIDDEENIQNLLYDILTSEGYKAILSDGGEEAIEIIKKQKIDLIILDMMMPKATGQELYTSMKVKLSQEGLEDRVPPAIILTAHPGAENTQFLLMTESGIKKLIPKPFQISELLEAIKETIK
ncbi:MAG TPA: response regulator [Spirochaetota bacterium]|nr:response regulator [Spirochaetota bacterium]HOL57094.1 response regulator [Spirochaetota bacterium]HPP04674.1 response regulator [Spirochaetota bacterium]